jgi:hypothetical protein
MIDDKAWSRFLSNLPADRPPDECWVWPGHRDRGGYGEFRVTRNRQVKAWRAHRLAYEFGVGPIPSGLVIDHLCRNRACVNPAHLEPVTNAENIRRGEVGNAVRMRRLRPLNANGEPVCYKGHAVVGDNMRRRVNKQGYVVTDCVQCRRDRSAKRRASRRAFVAPLQPCCAVSASP